MQNWDLDTEQNVQVWAGTHSTRETKEVMDETLDDATRLHSTQHDVQGITSETNDLKTN